MFKYSYPTGTVGNMEVYHYNVDNWKQLFSKIYSLSSSGYDYNEAFKIATSEMDDLEKNDFRHWLKFYQENNHMKYKMAQNFQNFPMSNVDSMSMFQAPKQPDASKDDIIKKKINSIISRLQSAEKLATNPEVREVLSNSLQIPLYKWLEELHLIKRYIQTAKISNAKTLDDLIVKHAYKIYTLGYPVAAEEFKKFAQVAPATEEPSADAPAEAPAADAAPAAPAADAMVPSPAPGPTAGPLPGIPIPTDPNAAGLPAPEVSSELSEALEGEDDGTKKSPLDKLIDNLNFNDTNDVIGPEGDDYDPLAEIVVTAQEVNQMAQQPITPQQRRALKPAQVEQEPEEKEQFASTVMHKKTDDLIEAALGQVSVKDIIYRLESLVNLFRTREIPRQLAIVDLMMDHLNLSSFFPTLAEASSKTLESNQYALTRIEEILSKLKGSIKNTKDQEIDLLGTNPIDVSDIPEGLNPESIKQNLEGNKKIEDLAKQERREHREQQESERRQLESPAESDLEVSQDDLNQPAEVVPPQARPVATKEVAPQQVPQRAVR